MAGIGERLKNIRLKFNKTQKDVAEVLVMKQSQYSRIESGISMFPVDRLAVLADFYGVTIDYLLDHECGRECSALELKLRDSGLKYSLSGDRIVVRVLGKVFYVTSDVLDGVLDTAMKKSYAMFSKAIGKLTESFVCAILLKKADDGDFDVDTY